MNSRISILNNRFYYLTGGVLLFMVFLPGYGFSESANDQSMIFVKGGCFEMGCGIWSSDCDSDELPVHSVCLDDFHIDMYEVRQKEYEKVTGSNPSRFRGINRPVDSVSWYEAGEYCEALGMRLPTEAEWEYAARSGGKKEKWAGFNSRSDLGDYAWYYDNAEKTSHPVGQKKPNGLGIYDMTGNVWEWVNDWFHEDYYRHSPMYNPAGPPSDQKGLRFRILRGGSLVSNERDARTADRVGNRPYFQYYTHGFRCARTASQNFVILRLTKEQ